ncbi:ScbA/BarX family gamma-butyrolactone biosynthesis protein [Streptomyces sp. NPDC051956]|uniref:ScbA/BarX family gamma-butyrolactone biosynthesis protein n=1 Tax=Streptomyces sp. NPDC051956 TaxID=3365677 RepID=UPI0037CEE5E0
MTLSTAIQTTRHIPGGAQRTVFPTVPLGTRPSAPAETVNKSLVHRTYSRDVLPTGITQHSDEHFTISTRWPAEHGLFLDSDGRYSPSLVIETIRQTGLFLTHQALGVPLGHEFVVWDMSHRIDPEHLVKGQTPTDLELDTHVSGIRKRGRVPSDIELRMTIRRAGQIIGTGGTHYAVTSPGGYRRLRGDLVNSAWSTAMAADLPDPVDPPTVHRTRLCDVVLAPADGPGRWLLRLDTTNTVLFDHANDHVPAMALLEAAQQAARATLDSRPFNPSSCEVSCARYVEFGTPCWIEARLTTGDDGTTSICVTGRQDDQPVFTVQFRQAADSL